LSTSFVKGIFKVKGQADNKKTAPRRDTREVWRIEDSTLRRLTGLNVPKTCYPDKGGSHEVFHQTQPRVFRPASKDEIKGTALTTGT